MGHTLDWYLVENRQDRKVVLVEATKYEDVMVSKVTTALMGSGLYEWENYLAQLFVEAVAAREDDIADVTKMFSCDLVGEDQEGRYTKPCEKVVEFLLEKLFDIVSEIDNTITVSVKPNALL